MRSGIRIRGSRGHPLVRAALIRFACWLRTEFEFPIRVPIYLNSGRTITTMDGSVASASFFGPFDRTVEPYIRIATGDFDELTHELGSRDDVLACYIISLAHEVIHYHQWIETGHMSERGVDAKAVRMLNRYAESVDHP